MKKIAPVLFALLFVFSGAFSVVRAEETTSSTQSQLESLKAMVLQLQEKLAALQMQNNQLKQEVTELREFGKDLSEGVYNEDVKDLQELLSGYDDVYPEGVVSGYYGPLTREAVKRFQKKLGIEETGTVGPKTRQVLNKLLDDGKITEEELKMLPMGIQKFDRPLPPGIWKNLKEKRGFAKMKDLMDDDSDDDTDEDENEDEDEDEDESDDDSDDDSNDDSDEDEDDDSDED